MDIKADIVADIAIRQKSNCPTHSVLAESHNEQTGNTSAASLYRNNVAFILQNLDKLSNCLSEFDKQSAFNSPLYFASDAIIKSADAKAQPQTRDTLHNPFRLFALPIPKAPLSHLGLRQSFCVINVVLIGKRGIYGRHLQ